MRFKTPLTKLKESCSLWSFLDFYSKTHEEEVQRLNTLRENEVRRAEKSDCQAAAVKYKAHLEKIEGALDLLVSEGLIFNSLSLVPIPEVEFIGPGEVDTTSSEDLATTGLENTGVVIVEDHVLGEDHVGDEGPVDGAVTEEPLVINQFYSNLLLLSFDNNSVAHVEKPLTANDETKE
ncbi:hypothetical protein F2Q69_00058651 [Brassica cretica]|uniref:Uncharacterized protein n=1 Tax=Brassica cretica TaxID=69181 RepID=A0A8S9RII0_BRACR|nr:hypothetical protein F2Q69_00058651 [Brassica cretica]